MWHPLPSPRFALLCLLQCVAQHDQSCAYKLTRDPQTEPHPADPRLHSAWGKRLWLGILPPRWVRGSRVPGTEGSCVAAAQAQVGVRAGCPRALLLSPYPSHAA